MGARHQSRATLSSVDDFEFDASSNARKDALGTLKGKHFYTQLTRDEVESVSLGAFLLLVHGYQLEEAAPYGQLNAVEELIEGDPAEVKLGRLAIEDTAFLIGKESAEEEFRARYPVGSEEWDLLSELRRADLHSGGGPSKEAVAMGKRFEREVAARMKESGVMARPQMTSGKKSAQAKRITPFQRLLRTELLRRQWRALTLTATAVRYQIDQSWTPVDAPDDNHGHLDPPGRMRLIATAFRAPDGDWFDAEAGPGCEPDETFTPEDWNLMVDADPSGEFNWDESDNKGTWVLTFRDDDAKQESLPTRSDFAHLSERQIDSAYKRSKKQCALLEVLFHRRYFEVEHYKDGVWQSHGLYRGWGWEGERFILRASPEHLRMRLHGAERLRRKVASVAPRGATHVEWREVRGGNTARRYFEPSGFRKSPSKGPAGDGLVQLEAGRKPNIKVHFTDFDGEVDGLSIIGVDDQNGYIYLLEL